MHAFQCIIFSPNSKFPILLCGKQLHRILPKSVKNNGLCGQIFMYVSKYSISVSLSIFSRNSWLFDNDCKTFLVLNSIKIRQNVYSLIAGHDEADGYDMHTGCSFLFYSRKERLNKDNCQLTATTMLKI
jgi:hypothetical protein